MLSRYRVLRTACKENVWLLPKDLMLELRLRENQPVKLGFGSAMTMVRTHTAPEGCQSTDTIALSPPVMSALSIPDNITLTLNSENKNSYRLGPLIGVLTFSGHVPNALNFYRAYALAAKDRGILYVFKGSSISLPERIIEGYYYNFKEKRWQQGQFPFPDVVIDRCYPNGYISHARLEKVIGRNKIFNKKTMIDKLDFFKAIDKDPVLKPHMPETQVFTETSQLISLLNKYSEVFLKPINAMKGFGIVVVKRGNNKKLECTYATHDKTITKQINSPDEIHSVLFQAAERRRPYLIQQGIKRMEYKGGPFSIRTWAMKNGKGTWVIPGIFAKGSFGNSFLTNFTAGAKLIPLKELFSDIIPRLPYNKNILMNMLEDLTLKTAAVLDEQYGPLGELGFDIVFDDNGSLWILEANGNPGVIPIFIQKEYPLWSSLLFVYPIEFATYLAGFR